MKIKEALKAIEAHKRKKRRGRGSGSGHGKTSCRGHKGAKARSGKKLRPGYEGGQMPLIRRIPKRGFANKFKKEYQIVNVETLDHYRKDSTVDMDFLREQGAVKNPVIPVKILGDGKLSKPLIVKAHAFSKSARKKIEEAGGKAEIVSDIR